MRHTEFRHTDGAAGGAGKAGEAGRPTAADQRAGDDAGKGLTRVTVNLNRQAVQALEEVSAATQYSKTDTINRALQVYAIVQKILDRDGGVLQVQHRDGETVQIHIL